MSVPPEQFARLQGRVNTAELAHRLVVVIGVGAVGSQIARELANHALGRLRLIDDDTFSITNRPRHALPVEYVNWNKAEAMTVYLAAQVEGLRPQAVPRKVDDSVTDDQLDAWLQDADLIVAATDDRNAQRRIARRALALDIPVLLPGLYEGAGGEIFLQRSPRRPCFLCWDAFRPADQAVHGAAGGNADVLEIVVLTTQLSLGLLDRSSPYRRQLLVPERSTEPPPQLFVWIEHVLGRRSVTRRPNCPSCAVGPALGNDWITAPTPTTPRAQVATATPFPRTNRAGLVVVALIVLITVVIFSLSAGNSHPGQATAATKTPQEQAAQEQSTAERYIAKLNFKCPERYICHLAIGEVQELPLYIEGMDQRLANYLSAHGYTDLWTDSDHTFAAESIGPRNLAENTRTPNRYISGQEARFTYVASTDGSEDEQDETGLMFENTAPGVAWGMMPPAVEKGAVPWTVEWQLKDSAGEVVRRLHFTVAVSDCHNSEPGEPTPCGRSLGEHENDETVDVPPAPSPFPYGNLES